MTGGSLFSGIGGLDLALESCGITPVWQVEVDSFCNSVLERHWPDVRRYTDIRAIDWAGVERPDMLCAGFPCQPFSVAGQNRGADDERNMWPETLRAIRELRPRYVFLENVPGLLAHGYFGRILGDLAEGGYDAVWDTFPAAEVGAPHKRERLFILAYARQQHEHLQQRAVGPEPAKEDGGLAYAPGVRCESGQQVARETRRQEQRWREELAGRGVDVGHADIERGASGAEPTVRGRQASAGLTGGSVADAAGSRQRPSLGDDDARQPDATGSDATMADSDDSRLERRRDGRSECSDEWPVGKGRAEVGDFPPGPDDRDAWARVLAEVPTLEPAVCRVATGVPDRTHRLKALGNAVVPAQGAWAFRTLWQRMGT